MRTSSQFVAAAGLAAASSLAGAQEQHQNLARISIATSNDCTLLGNQCRGSQRTLRLETPSGFYIVARTFDDKAAYSPFNRSVDILDTVHLHAELDRSETAKGVAGLLGYKFKLGEATGINLEAYAVKGTASASLTARASAVLDAGDIIIPAVSWHGHKLEGTQLSWEKQKGEWAYDIYRAEGRKGNFGGLREAFGTSFQLHDHMHLTLSQFAQAGLERMHYGVGVGGVYTSEKETGVGRNFASICQDGVFSASSRFAVALSACGKKITKDMTYDKLLVRTGRIAGQINEYGAKAQNEADRIEDKTGYGYDVPVATASSVADKLGFPSPYGRVHMALVFAVSARPLPHTFVSMAVTKAQNQPVATTLTAGLEF